MRAMSDAGRCPMATIGLADRSGLIACITAVDAAAMSMPRPAMVSQDGADVVPVDRVGGNRDMPDQHARRQRLGDQMRPVEQHGV